MSEKVISDCVKHVYKRFISDAGDLEINLNDSMKKQITSAIESEV